MQGGFHFVMQNLSKVCFWGFSLLFVFCLVGCGTKKSTEENSEKKEVVKEETDNILDTEEALQVVMGDWDDVGFQYEEKEIVVSNIQEYGTGYLFSMKYLGTGACCNLFYVENQNGKWKVIKRGEGTIDMSPGISISTVRIEDKMIVWGSVGEAIYETEADRKKEVTFGKLNLVSKSGKKCTIPLKNNQQYLQVTDLENVKSWKVLDTEGNVILDKVTCKKDYGSDLLE